VSQEPAHNRLHSVRQLEQAVARDLEALLNTRRQTLDEVPAELTEVSRSLLTYGLPDLSSANLLNTSERDRVRRTLEEAITTFEPRLQRVRVTLEPPRPQDPSLRFRIDAVLRVEPAREPVTFDAELRLVTREYTVQGHA
jgi:type VI secretion system protein ImpF